MLAGCSAAAGVGFRLVGFLMCRQPGRSNLHPPSMSPEKPAPVSPIAAGNDRLRQNLFVQHADGRVLMTHGVANDPRHFEILEAVEGFRDFAPENDPYGEHDFGCVEIDDQRYFFKIDYYADETLSHGAESPAESCFRVLTIMRADEY